MNLFLRYAILSLLLTLCLTKEQSTSPSIDGSQDEGFNKSISIPQHRKTLTFTYAFKKQPTIEDSLGEDDFASAYEEKILHHSLTRSPKGNPESKKYRKKKKRSQLPLNYERSSQGKSPKSDRKLQISSLVSRELNERYDSLDDLSAVAESGNRDNQFKLRTFLSSLARRRRSDSRPSSSDSDSRSGKGKGRGRGKKKSRRSGSKGKGKSRRSGRKGKRNKRGRSYDSRSYDSPSDSYDSPSDSYESADSKDIGTSEDIEGIFGDEFIDFLNEYYQYSSDIGAESSDEEDTFEEFLNNYYKFKEGKNENTAETGDDFDKYYLKPTDSYYSPQSYYRVTPSPLPWQEENYRDPDDDNTPAPVPTKTKSKKVTYYYYDDIFSDDMMPTTNSKLYPRPTPPAPTSPTKKKEGGESEPSFNFDDDFDRNTNQSPSASKKLKEGRKSTDLEVTAPSPSNQQPSNSFFDDDFVSSAKMKTSSQSSNKNKKVTNKRPSGGPSRSRKNIKRPASTSKKSDGRASSTRSKKVDKNGDKRKRRLR